MSLSPCCNAVSSEPNLHKMQEFLWAASSVSSNVNGCGPSCHEGRRAVAVIVEIRLSGQMGLGAVEMITIGVMLMGVACSVVMGLWTLRGVDCSGRARPGFGSLVLGIRGVSILFGSAGTIPSSAQVTCFLLLFVHLPNRPSVVCSSLRGCSLSSVVVRCGGGIAPVDGFWVGSRWWSKCGRMGFVV